MQNDQQTLERQLGDAEATLKASLSEACGSDPVRADTGELIRIEEVLAIATDAAKKAISIRRKRRHSRSARDGTSVAVGVDAGGEAAGSHRTFADADGTVWTVWGVHPSDKPGAKPRLRGSFQQGWLAFECASAKRRLSPVPIDWQTADEQGLRAYLERAKAAPVRRPDARSNREP